MATAEKSAQSIDVRAEVATISWRAICHHTEMTVWVKCSRGNANWNLPLEVLPNLEVLVPETEAIQPALNLEVLRAAQLAASRYIDRYRLNLKEIFRQVH